MYKRNADGSYTINYGGTGPKLPVTLTAEEERAAVRETREELVRRLVSRGVPLDKATALGFAHEPQIQVNAKAGGPEIRIKGLFRSVGMDGLVREVLEAVRLEQYGPDPEALLVERLQAAGLSHDDAAQKAHRRVYREADGRITARLKPGAVMQGKSADDDLPLVMATNAVLREVEAIRPLPDLPDGARIDYGPL